MNDALESSPSSRVQGETRSARVTTTFTWLFLVVACATPMARVIYSPNLERTDGVGVVVGVLFWTWAMVAFERRAVRRGHRAARARLRLAAAAFAAVQGILAVARPEWLSILYIPAVLFSALGFPLMLIGHAGVALVQVLAGGLEVFLIVTSMAEMASFRLGWKTEFQ